MFLTLHALGGQRTSGAGPWLPLCLWYLVVGLRYWVSKLVGCEHIFSWLCCSSCWVLRLKVFAGASRVIEVLRIQTQAPLLAYKQCTHKPHPQLHVSSFSHSDSPFFLHACRTVWKWPSHLRVLWPASWERQKSFWGFISCPGESGERQWSHLSSISWFFKCKYTVFWKFTSYP